MFLLVFCKSNSCFASTSCVGVKVISFLYLPILEYQKIEMKLLSRNI